MNNAKKLAVTLATGVALAASGVGVADTKTSQIDVSASITESCTIQNGTLAAGDIDPTSGSAIPFQGTVDVKCTAGTTATVGLDEGGGTGATTSVRKLVGANHAGTLNYAIYQDLNHNNNWGNDTGNDTRDVTGTGSTQTLNLYAVIASGQQSAEVDDYSDTVTATITFN